jgi:hypothetical protein
MSRRFTLVGCPSAAQLSRRPVGGMLVAASSVLACALLLRAPHRFAAGRAHAVASAAASAVDVVVVGGGPAGLAAATDLASAGLSVTVVERRETASAFEMQRAYLYLLDRRGQQWTDRHDLTATVRERGVLNKGYTITRAWPDELTRTPRRLRRVRTGYAYQPPALSTYRRRRAACPQGPAYCMYWVRWVRVQLRPYRGIPGGRMQRARWK